MIEYADIARTLRDCGPAVLPYPASDPTPSRSLTPPVLDYTDTDLNANLKCLSIYNLISVKITPLWGLIATASCRPWRRRRREGMPAGLAQLIDCRINAITLRPDEPGFRGCSPRGVADERAWKNYTLSVSPLWNRWKCLYVSNFIFLRCWFANNTINYMLLIHKSSLNTH